MRHPRRRRQPLLRHLCSLQLLLDVPPARVTRVVRDVENILVRPLRDHRLLALAAGADARVKKVNKLCLRLARRRVGKNLPWGGGAVLRLLDGKAQDVVLDVGADDLPACQPLAHALGEAAQAAFAGED